MRPEVTYFDRPSHHHNAGLPKQPLNKCKTWMTIGQNQSGLPVTVNCVVNKWTCYHQYCFYLCGVLLVLELFPPALSLNWFRNENWRFNLREELKHHGLANTPPPPYTIISKRKPIVVGCFFFRSSHLPVVSIPINASCALCRLDKLVLVWHHIECNMHDGPCHPPTMLIVLINSPSIDLIVDDQDHMHNYRSTLWYAGLITGS